MFGEKLIFNTITLHHGYGSPLEFSVRDKEECIKIDFDDFNREFFKKNYNLKYAIEDLEKIVKYLKDLENEDIE